VPLLTDARWGIVAEGVANVPVELVCATAGKAASVSTARTIPAIRLSMNCSRWFERREAPSRDKFVTLAYMTAMPQAAYARFAVAPMMDWTDRRCRAFHRLMTRRARLYSEMVTADAVVFGPRERLIGFDLTEHPVALQLGGADPARLAEAARIGADFGYDEINLNCGCPSDRVQSGRFGACLMREPTRVADGVAAMANAVAVPVTVKCRIGVDEQEPREALFAFAAAVRAAGAAALIVHARKAWLDGLSPKDNRTVPPLDYGIVYDLKHAYPDWPIVLNGGVQNLAAARAHFAHVDGVMLGRAAYQNPELLLGVDAEIFGEAPPFDDPFGALEAFMPVIAAGLERGERLHDFTRHLLGLFAGRPGARLYRRTLASDGVRADAGLEVLRRAVARVGRDTPVLAAAG
jgi:tRNA-dihydrouridine synthase A